MTSLSHLAFFYIFLLWSALTLAFITPKSWTLLGYFMPEGLALRGLEWLWRWVVFVLLGFGFDAATWAQPHAPAQEPAFYLAALTLGLVLTLPSLVYYFVVTKRLH